MGDRQQIAATVLTGGLGSIVAGIALIAVKQQAVDHRWGYGLVALGVLIVLVGGVMWFTRSATHKPSVRADHGSTAAGGDIKAEGASHVGPVTIGTYNAAPTAAPPRNVDRVIRQLRAKVVREYPNSQLRDINTADALLRCANDLGLGGATPNPNPILGGPFPYDILPTDLVTCFDHWHALGIVHASERTSTYYLTELGRDVVEHLERTPAAAPPQTNRIHGSRFVENRDTSRSIRYDEYGTGVVSWRCTGWMPNSPTSRWALRFQPYCFTHGKRMLIEDRMYHGYQFSEELAIDDIFVAKCPEPTHSDIHIFHNPLSSVREMVRSLLESAAEAGGWERPTAEEVAYTESHSA